MRHSLGKPVQGAARRLAPRRRMQAAQTSVSVSTRGWMRVGQFLQSLSYPLVMRCTADASILFSSQRNASGAAIGTGVRACDGPRPRPGALLMRRPEPGANAAPCATSIHAHTWCPRIVLVLDSNISRLGMHFLFVATSGSWHNCNDYC